MHLREAQMTVGVRADGQYGPATCNAIAARLKKAGNYDEFALLKIGKHFTLREVLKSNVARRRGISNLPDGAQLLSLFRTAAHILDPVREHFDAPVTVTSGLRGNLLNRLVGGSWSSQHVKGESVDFRVAGQSNKAVCIWIRDNIAYDQLIYEFGESGWVHGSYRRGRLRHDWKSAVKRLGRTRYLSRVFRT